MIGLALMAMRLAERRTGCTLLSRAGESNRPVHRDHLAKFGPWPASKEYYRIIDRISAGERP